MEYIFFTVGVVVGSIITQIIRSITSASGILKIDCSNPEKDIYRLELDNLDELRKKSRVELSVKHDDLSQK